MCLFGVLDSEMILRVERVLRQRVEMVLSGVEWREREVYHKIRSV